MLKQALLFPALAFLVSAQPLSLQAEPATDQALLEAAQDLAKHYDTYYGAKNIDGMKSALRRAPRIISRLSPPCMLTAISAMAMAPSRSPCRLVKAKDASMAIWASSMCMEPVAGTSRC